MKLWLLWEADEMGVGVMPRYRVRVYRETTEEVVVEVEASNPDHAEDTAMDEAHEKSEMDWVQVGQELDVTATEIEVVEDEEEG